MIRPIITLGLAALILSTPVQSKINPSILQDIISKVDTKTGLFILHANTQREKILNDPKIFAQTQKMLPVSYGGYTLENMDIQQRELQLSFTTTLDDIPKLWNTNPKVVVAKYATAVCRVFKRYPIQTLDIVSSRLYYQGHMVGRLSINKNQCNKLKSKK